MTLHPNYAVAPGEYLAEWLEESESTQSELSRRLGVSRKLVNEIVNGKAPITDETALLLERVTTIPADSWLRFEARYRQELARLHDETDLAAHADEIPDSTAKYLRVLGATTATRRAPGRLVGDLLKFHRYGTWSAFEEAMAASTAGHFAMATLKENKKTFDSITCATWLRAGENSEAFERGRRLVFKSHELRAALPRIRARAASSDESLLSDLQEMLAEVGVILAFVDPPNGLPLYGVTRWIDQRVPMIQQSGRRAKDGFIIWTLFHELGHVLNDPRGQMHLEFKSAKARSTAAERGANEFAFEALFGPNGLEPFDGCTSDRAIADRAREVGVSPGVAVHQLHRRRKLPYNYGTRLLVDLAWQVA